jgi:hypothetical protein
MLLRLLVRDKRRKLIVLDLGGQMKNQLILLDGERKTRKPF